MEKNSCDLKIYIRIIEYNGQYSSSLIPTFVLKSNKNCVTIQDQYQSISFALKNNDHNKRYRCSSVFA